jgi:hypothetical protein
MPRWAVVRANNDEDYDREVCKWFPYAGDEPAGTVLPRQQLNGSSIAYHPGLLSNRPHIDKINNLDFEQMVIVGWRPMTRGDYH